jgi:WD40 repeat protein
LFVSKDHHQHNHNRHKNIPSTSFSIEKDQPHLNQLSDQFWSTVNPQKDITWLQIQPPELFIFDNDKNRVQEHLNSLQQFYQVKSKAIHYKPEHRPSRFRAFVLSLLQSTFVFLLGINIPILILCLVLIGIITWMTPKWRKQWLVPLLIHCFNQFFLYLIRSYPTQYLKRMYFMLVKKQSFEGGIKEYDADGIHRGAISAQNIFNQQQYRANVKTVQVCTLTNQHIADIQNLDVNAKQSLVSCGQDGRIILWNVDSKKATWMARFDKLYPTRGGILQALLNPVFFSSNKKKSFGKKSLRQQQQQHPISLSKNYLSKARLVKIDQGNKWAVVGYDDGLIRVWNVNTGTLVREMDVHPHMPSVEVHEEQSNNNTMRNRFTSGKSEPTSPTLSHSSFAFSSASPASSNATIHTTGSVRKGAVDRILSIAFIGVITEFCHPLVAEAAARCRSSDIEASQNYLVSAHKSGVLNEWDILSGECIQTIKTGHTKDITQLHVVDSKAPHRKLGVTWVFTSSKDGTVKCWDRRFITPSIMKQTTTDDDDSYDLDQQQTTKWSLVYTINLNSPVTSIATELPVGGMGVLVTGCSDGTVKVWNFETGESVCTLSLGKVTSASSQSISSAASVVSDYGMGNAGGPIRKFSKFSTHMTNHNMSDSSDDDSSDSSLSSYSRHTTSDHRGAIYQVVVTRYCEVENGPGLCRGCDTCFGNGFLIASSAMDNKVHSWRLERSDNGHEGSCTLCTKDYHRKQYKHRKSSIGNIDDGVSDTLLHISATSSGRRRRSAQQGGHSPTVKKRHVAARTPIASVANTNNKDDLLELLDIEQLAGDTHIPLRPTFLGKIDQPAGRGVVFCDKILAGVRRRRSNSLLNNKSQKKHGNNEWEAWFASLQYYDPSLSKEDGSINNMKIPIETFNLNNDQQSISLTSLADKEEDLQKATQVLKGTLLSLFSSSASPSAGSNNGVATTAQVKDQLRYKGIHAHTSEGDEDAKKLDNENSDFDVESLEASENLPFSTVRHVIPLDGAGLACDFGNFIKLVYLDKPSLTEKEHAKQTRDAMEDHKRPQTIVEQVVVEEDENEESSNCQCGSNGGATTACSPANKGKNGCCGGVNKEKNGGKCCGDSGKIVKKKQENRQQKLLLKKQKSSFDSNNTCGGIRSIAECSLKNNCSRAADCASSNQALASSASVSTFSNWL